MKASMLLSSRTSYARAFALRIQPSQGWKIQRCFSAAINTVPEEDKQGSLAGLKILDLSRVLAAPFCTQILADYGAEVIKVEAIKTGDDTRHWKMQGEDATWNAKSAPISYYFSAINRNKKSIALNLKKDKGKEIVLELAKQADILVENFKPGTMDRLGLGYESLSAANPRLIYASVSGYGTSGPFAGRGGYDPIAGAEAGLLHVTGEHNGPPVRPGIGVVDMATGLYLHGAILAAVNARHRTGKGQRVDASLFETQMSMLTNVGSAWLNLGIEAQRWGCQHPSIVPYNAFPTKDNYLMCGATNDAQFATLCKLLGLESLITDERFATNPKRVEHRDIINPIFDAAFRAKTTNEWIEEFEKTTLACAPINDMQGAFAHPQAKARDMIQEFDTGDTVSGKIKVIGPAVKFSNTPTRLRSPAPVLGQHTIEVLKTLGMGNEEIARLKTSGVIHEQL